MKTCGLKSFCGMREIGHWGGFRLLFASEVSSYSVFWMMEACRDALPSLSRSISSKVNIYGLPPISGLT
jgi:hypothetical protein